MTRIFNDIDFILYFGCNSEINKLRDLKFSLNINRRDTILKIFDLCEQLKDFLLNFFRLSNRTEKLFLSINLKYIKNSWCLIIINKCKLQYNLIHFIEIFKYLNGQQFILLKLKLINYWSDFSYELIEAFIGKLLFYFTNKSILCFVIVYQVVQQSTICIYQ